MKIKSLIIGCVAMLSCVSYQTSFAKSGGAAVVAGVMIGVVADAAACKVSCSKSGEGMTPVCKEIKNSTNCDCTCK